MRSYDVIVVGLGAMGSATIDYLARSGHHVLGLEQFSRGHDLGSSHGDSRIIREQYFEHPLYVPLVQRAYELWRQLEERTGRSLMTITGGLMIGPRDGMVVEGTIRSATTHNLPYELLTSREVATRFPAFDIRSDLAVVFDPRCGFLDPEACNSAHLDEAAEHGAELRFNETVLRWTSEGDGVRVETNGGSYLSSRLLLSTGGWTRSLLRDLDLPLTVERQVTFWLDPDESVTPYAKERFPIYAYEFKKNTICYGFPRLPKGVKASIMHDGRTSISPDSVDRTVHDDEIDSVRAALAPVLPDLSKARSTGSGVCLFTNTPDHNFIIDFHPDLQQVLISSPCSGHGFKFASVIGEIQADLLTTGQARFDLTPFGIHRFL